MADVEGDHEFESADAGASKTYPQQCSALRKNGYVVIKGRPCKIVEMSTSKTGKHGHAKVHMVGIDLFTAKKYEDICPSTHNMDVPNVSRKEYTVNNIEDGFVSLMDDDGNIREDLKVPDTDAGKDLQNRFDNDEALLATVLKAMDDESIISVKANTN